MRAEKGFTPLILIIIAALVIGAGVGGFLIFQEKKILSSEEIPQPKTQAEEKTETVSEGTTKKDEQKKEQNYISKTPQARDPWKDSIPAAPTNLALPIVVKDIHTTNELLSPYGIIRKSGDGGVGHGGIDFPLVSGSPIYAVANGTIIKNNVEDSGGGKTVDVLIVPGESQGEGWIFKYDHIALEPGLAVGSTVQKGKKIGINAFQQRGNNHIGLEYHIKGFTIAREKICWVDRLESIARQQLEDEFNRLKITSAFIQSWQTANEEGYYQYKGLFDEIKYPNGPQLCYQLGTDARIPLH